MNRSRAALAAAASIGGQFDFDGIDCHSGIFQR
jgi:hypothetical protein